MKMAQVQDELGIGFGTKVAFVSTTVGPERDAPKGIPPAGLPHGIVP
jgi:cytochrome oxidase Cu insertion factor (SCO1/SenC/PrrC family)